MFIIRRFTLALQMTFRRGCGEHRTKQDPRSFSAKYNLSILVFYQGFDSIVEAIAREKYIKGKTRKWLEALVNSTNPDWKDLTLEISLELRP